MSRFREFPSEPSPVALERWRVPVSWIDTPDAHVIGALPPERRAVWRACRSVYFLAEGGTPYDPRHVLTLRGAALVAWRARRRAWLRDEVFHADARVDLAA